MKKKTMKKSGAEFAQSSFERLLHEGFRCCGEWRTHKTHRIIAEPSNEEFSKTKNVLYAFVSGEDVKFIGETTRTVSKRMKDIRWPGNEKPDKADSTDRKNRKNIRALLDEGKQVKIYMLSLPSVGDLVNKVKTEWNKKGSAAKGKKKAAK
ncbi:MAG: hypothetical protein ACR2P5_02435 [Gammaproteobacteria bacterium]